LPAEPRWSADGRSIYSASLREGGAQVRKADLAGGRVARITQQGGWAPEESPDGSTLYFTEHDNQSTALRAMPTRGGEPRRVIGDVFQRAFAITAHAYSRISPSIAWRFNAA
jgi:Tol biopolymer transport system component